MDICMYRIWIYACKRHGHASNQGLHVFMFMHIRCIVGRASCSLVAMLGNLSRPWTTASDQHEAKQARTYDNITMKPTQASKAKYACIYVCHVALRQFPRAKLDQHTSQRRRRVLQQRQRLLLHHHRLSKLSELTSTTDHVDHVPGGSTELRPRRPRPRRPRPERLR